MSHVVTAPEFLRDMAILIGIGFVLGVGFTLLVIDFRNYLKGEGRHGNKGF